MKFSTAVLAVLPLAAAAAPQQAERLDEVAKRDGQAKPPYHFEFHYTGNFIQVGDVSLFHAVWERGFESGDSTGIESDDSYKALGFRVRCAYDDTVPDLKVNVHMKGGWGTVAGIPGITVRDQMIKAMWEMVEKVREEDDVVWKDCSVCGFGSCSDNKAAVCGRYRIELCDCDKHFGGGDAANGVCFQRSTTWRVPSEMNLALYDPDGTLRPDSLTISFSSAEIPKVQKGCGKLGAFAEVFLGMIPQFGKVISDQVKILCRK